MAKLNRKTRRERLRNPIKVFPFAFCAVSLIDDKNTHLIYRTLSNLSGREMFIIGSNQFFKGATNGLKETLSISYFKNWNEFFSYIREYTNYSLIAIEQSEKSIMLPEFEFPKKPCVFIFGSENFGLTDEVLLNADYVVEIPQFGSHPCYNASISSAIVGYEYVNKEFISKKEIFIPRLAK